MKTFDLRDNMRKKKAADSSLKKVIFMGTGFFALTILKMLLAKEDEYALVGIVTKPDARMGRGGKSDSAQINSIKELAFTNSIELLQPEKFDDAVLDRITELAPDVIIVASYGKILPAELLAIPPSGAINVHASLLPLLRGASPIQNAIINDFKETGITIMHMDTGMDTGNIISQKVIPITPDLLAADLEKTLAVQGAEFLTTTLTTWLSGKTEVTPQDPTKATLCQIIEREDGHIVWINETKKIYNLYRALTPWPGIFSYWRKSPTERIRVKLTAVRPFETSLDLSHYTAGTVFQAENELCIRTLDGAIVVETLQRADKKEMTAQAFLTGNQSIIGTILQ